MERLSMRKVRELLRLKYGVGLSTRKIADGLQIARNSVGEYLRGFSESGLAWPPPTSGPCRTGRPSMLNCAAQGSP